MQGRASEKYTEDERLSSKVCYYFTGATHSARRITKSIFVEDDGRAVSNTLHNTKHRVSRPVMSEIEIYAHQYEALREVFTLVCTAATLIDVPSP